MLGADQLLKNEMKFTFVTFYPAGSSNIWFDLEPNQEGKSNKQFPSLYRFKIDRNKKNL